MRAQTLARELTAAAMDDIRGHEGFATFARRHPEFATVLCATADRAAGFGVAVCTAPAGR
jgi:hypothetical protein